MRLCRGLTGTGAADPGAASVPVNGAMLVLRAAEAPGVQKLLDVVAHVNAGVSVCSLAASGLENVGAISGAVAAWSLVTACIYFLLCTNTFLSKNTRIYNYKLT